MKKLKLALTGLMGLSVGFWLTSDRLQANCYYSCACSTFSCSPCYIETTFGYDGCDIECFLGTCTCAGAGGPMSCV
jgi:hypothetical protein